jgi:hypothetical protein
MSAEDLMRYLGVPLLFTLVVTLLITPILTLFYRNRLKILMAARGAGQGLEAASSSPAALASSVPAPAQALVALGGLGQRAGRAMAARCNAYAAAAGVQALVLTALFARDYGSAMSWFGLLVVLLVFLLPTVWLVIQIRAVCGWFRLGGGCLALLGVLMVLGRLLGVDAVSLMLSVGVLHMLLPALLLLVLNLRFWRGAAPFVFLIALAGFFGWNFAFRIGGAWLGSTAGEPLLVVLRLIGLAAGSWLALLLLQKLGQVDGKAQLSDQELRLDLWMLIYTIVQALIFPLQARRGDVDGAAVVALVLVLGSFGVYWLLKRYLLARFSPRIALPARLLMLRVFGNNRRSESLFEQLRQAWNGFGSIELIAGTDLALQQITLPNFMAFLRGRLADRFDCSGSELVARLARPPQQLADGSFHAHQSPCHADRWLAVVNRLLGHCDAVVMDLREFNDQRQGCWAELQALADGFGGRPVVLVVDGSTDRKLLDTILAKLAVAVQPASAAQWALVSAGRQDGSTVRSVLQTIEASVAAQPWGSQLGGGTAGSELRPA